MHRSLSSSAGVGQLLGNSTPTPMPIIQGKNTTEAAPDYTYWGLVHFKAGQRNITEPHFHDCDEFVFMVSGKMTMRSEGILYTLEGGDVLVTRAGFVHEVVEIIEDTCYFWAEGELRGLKRTGHLDPKLPGCLQPEYLTNANPYA